MPKEIVYGADPFAGFASSDDPPVNEEDGPPVVVVGWSRERGDVQIVTRLLRAEVALVELDGRIPVKYGMYVNLDRPAINALIRNLRRARDQAFGRDE